MARVQVKYTHKRGNHYNPHERIQGIAGESWYRSEPQVLDDLRTGLNSYFVSVGGREADVIPANHNGRAYIKTTADGYSPDNLLALPEPPARLLP